jgi:hypothetical protein
LKKALERLKKLGGEGAGFGCGGIFGNCGIIFLDETRNVERVAFCE